MNNVSLVGRLVRDPEVRYTDSQVCVTRFSIACDRPYAKDGDQRTDYISCIAFGKSAEFIEKYFGKGKPIGIIGRIQTGSYERDGKKTYTTDVVAKRVEFVGNKEGNGTKSNGSEAPEGFSALDDGDITF